MKITVKKVFVFKIHAAKLQPIYFLLEQSLKNESMILAHWTYSRKEWMAFLKRSDPRHNIFFYVYRFLHSLLLISIPEIRVTNGQVCIGKSILEFNNRNNQLKNIELNAEGDINILTITTEKLYRKNKRKISVPVPKGRLREAIELQHKLNSVN